MRLNHALKAVNQEPVDPNFSNVSLLLHGDGTNGTQNNTFVDSSSNNFTITRNGNATQGTFTPFSQPAGAWSNSFAKNDSWLTVPANAALAFGTGDFTIEFWTNYNDTTCGFIDMRGASPTNPNFAIYAASGSIKVDIGTTNRISTTTPTVNVWNHIALTRSGADLKLFVNGTQSGSTASDSTNVSTAQITYIGTIGGGTTTYDINGYISNLRILKGTALYTANFTPPTALLTAITNTQLLTCQDNRFKDNSANNFAITVAGSPAASPVSPFAPSASYSPSVNGGSLYFDGSADYLSCPSSTAYDFGTGDFTIELFAYRTGAGTGDRFLISRGNSTNFLLRWTTGGSLQFYINGSLKLAYTFAFALNTWCHIAVTRSGTDLRMYVDGVSVANTTDSTSFSTSANTVVIGDQAGFDSFAGYISNARILKGTAQYTGASFTPPTAPLTAITNTQLLLSGTNAGIFDNAAKNDLETVANAQISTTQKKYGTGSMYFDGTGDWLLVPNLNRIAPMTGNWTIEFWLNLVSLPAGTAYLFNQNASANYGTTIDMSSAGTLRFWLTTDGMSWIGGTYSGASSVNLSTATWYHVALVRNGTTVTLYIDGTSRASATGVTATYVYSDQATYVMGYGGLNPPVSYIDDFRITNGVARYTADFTPPTAAFPNR